MRTPEALVELDEGADAWMRPGADVEAVALRGLEHDVLVLEGRLPVLVGAHQQLPEVGEPPGECRQLRRALLQRRLPCARDLLAALDGGPAQLDGAELAAPIREGCLGGLGRPTALVELGGERVELRLTTVELGGVVAQQRVQLALELAQAPLPSVELHVRPARRRVVGLAAGGRRGRVGAFRGREELAQSMPAGLIGGSPSRPLPPFPLRACLPLHPVPPVARRRRPSSAVEFGTAADAWTVFRGCAGSSCPNG